mmetsp:Transcript_10569/g.22741  ORF Transcript_10569/g.22741 Transcript_10569/m.22741 type:complete len:243 (-) Transcript_10569:311-1039(-)
MALTTSSIAFFRAWHDRGSRGSVYVFSKTSTGSWTQHQKLAPASGPSQSNHNHGNYGHSVAISDSMLAVKAPSTYGKLGSQRGTVYIHKKGSNGQFVETHLLSTPEGPDTESFHNPQVALLDDFVIVGAPRSEKAYVFKSNGSGGYYQTTELTPSDDGPLQSNFGLKVDGRGTDVLVTDRDNLRTYLFSYDGEVWKERAKFDGHQSAFAGNSIVVHSPLDFRTNRGSYGGQVSFYDLVCENV